MSLQTFINGWERSVFVGLCFSIALLGIGGLEIATPGLSVSAWSVSRTTFFFWVTLKVMCWIQRGRPQPSLSALRPLAPLYAFFAAVTLSLLHDFRLAGDYRYFVLACAHALMVVDLFSTPDRQRWLPPLMGVLPLVLIVRGLAHDPSVFNFDLAYRFGFPLDHPNTAGYLLAMSMPLCLIVAVTWQGAWRGVAWVSWTAQLLTLLLTYSRGAYLGWGASMFVFGVLHRKWKYLIVMIVVAATCVIALPSLRQRATTIIRPDGDLAISERLEVLKDAFRVGIENPVLGVGYGRGHLKEALRKIYQDPAKKEAPIWHAHNVYVELFAGTGLLGLGMFLWLVGGALHCLLRSAFARAAPERTQGFLIAASLSAAMVAGVGDIPFYHHETRIFFFTLLAWAYLFSRHAESRSSGRL